MTRLKLLLPLLLLAAFSAGGCQTAVGNYFGNRARDFGECFRLEVGGYGIGASAHLSAMAHPGLDFWADRMSVGWYYGKPLAYGVRGEHARRYSGHVILCHYDSGVGEDDVGGPVAGHFCPFIFSGVAVEAWPNTNLTEEERAARGAGRPRKLPETGFWGGRGGPLWSQHGADWKRWSRVHAFDVEVSAALGLGVRAGFSPGEFLDFLLGWFGVDIAGDDVAWPPEASDG